MKEWILLRTLSLMIWWDAVRPCSNRPNVKAILELIWLIAFVLVVSMIGLATFLHWPDIYGRFE